ncbi:MAG: AAA family ATPase [Caldilineaceae bacterium]|nr:AAA family ATPase [Caldilineaceae bacterium]
MMRLPYGISNFPKLVRDGYHFVDRTHFIAQIEAMNEPYLFFLRPRRFGKSLFISLLQCYYGVEYRDEFEMLFGAYEIGRQPTPLANQYLVLRLDFSHINTQTTESTFAGFLSNVKHGVSIFMRTYRFCFVPDDESYVLSGNNPTDVFNRLIERANLSRAESADDYKIYVLIDEYDHFANELVAFRLEEFKQSVSRNGYVRKFYESIKSATGSGGVDRIFITGVSPLTLDSLTSGFNIGKHISLNISFHNMMGFTEAEVQEILLGIGVTEAELPQLTANLRQWYNGYLFNEAAKTRLYNPDMVLYFATELVSTGNYPTDLLDINIASDYGKIRDLFRIEGQEVQNLAVINELITEQTLTAQLTRQFSFEKEFTRDDLISLLFYLGIVTVKGAQLSRLVFEPPNFVITQLYFTYFQRIVLQQAELRVDDLRIYDRVVKLAQENEIAPTVEAVEMILKQLSNRDAVGFDEKYVKAVFASLLYPTQIYTIQSEYETDRRYVDLLLIRRPPIHPNYQFAFELKYLKQSDAHRLAAVKKEGLAQMQEYLRHEKLRTLTDLRAWLLVFVGPKAEVVVEVTSADDPLR